MSPIWTQNCLLQVEHFGPNGGLVEDLAVHRAARSPSAVTLRCCSADTTPLLIRLRDDGRSKPRPSQVLPGVSRLRKAALRLSLK